MIEYLSYLIIGLAARYPKVRLQDAFVMFDLTEFMIYLAALRLGLWEAVSLILLLNWIPQLYSRLEGPTDAVIRTATTTFGLILFYLLKIMGVPAIFLIVIPSFASTLLWALTFFFILSVRNPVLILGSVGQAVLYYRAAEWYFGMATWSL